MSISINDVARVAGVSKSTVSRVLGGGPVSEAVRGRVEAAIRQTGYHPNLQARRLRARHTGIIGLIVADIRNPFFTALIRAVEEVAYREGLRVTLCNTDEDPEREALYLQLMHEERISGLIFAPTRTTVGRLERLTLDYPTVLVDRAAPGGSIDSVVLDNPAAMAGLVEHLVARGYRRIGGLFGSTSTTAAERRDGYLAAMRTHGLQPDYREVEPTAEAAIATVDQWLAGPSRPEALVASNSLLLMGALKAARSAGLAIPDALALAGFDNERWTELVEPGITVIEQPVEEMGRAAMSLLLERLRAPELPVRRLVMTGRCVVRGSTALR
ncbi:MULTISPECIES: LacI family DNA-binding transcriptional regulator [Stenotrophomonas]|jgi:LacI family fructose operon transcriptional repressor|uniref:LacI family transcriptional regulator n=1 Tax=Stenotrophomonas riyadhensis TaxID=2859893 RepID=A0ABT2XCH4_9GAMM|nr:MULTISPECIES: LacI family DNA-binding transcriptional regulator [Stenotrophomonas]AWT14905.1 LacI family transcriptional regulator [Stenotrophomonas maltophilia]EKU9957441.1 LacI family DNA-binding transcriptional regulator [Stenotrophomonas maltophilia]EKU9984311.1 LacI family DNA-binding transcriptional regulator [Stenotrophomonas maltophilia]ELF4098582.1 LacI family DNA-binding transcriptional regulator [Stenotrophomonas maltophilia]MBA0286134.1 LacI family DNA-binding transcriptional re